jgi:hypothetical protein
MDELCKDVWREVFGGIVHDDEGIYFDADGITCDPIAHTWADAERVVVRLREERCLVDIAQDLDGWTVTVMRETGEMQYAAFQAHDPSMPVALFKAALAAKREVR